MYQSKKKIIALKLTGEIFKEKDTLSGDLVRNIAGQIKQLQESHCFGLIIGGGNFFRGKYGIPLGISSCVSDQAGMLATLMNGTLLQDLLAQEGIDTRVLSAIDCPSLARTFSLQELDSALKRNDCVIFVGGIGLPGFTTDTTAIVRAMQMNAFEIWKATNVDGVYTNDPKIDKNATRLEKISYQDALNRHFGIMDETAFLLAQKHRFVLRIFSIFEKDALIKAASNPNFGSMIVP